ncbi:GNAT family N-acetyltransferase [Pseudonocardia bannensis]|uniref:GNAT family N-acetyltransferase n=1 Tax=Pseudonocardia bannensis TaxID=630973 RepID=A0A848DG08_9PSEU|nr:GNAT family N-acetyltransferase [Pseudonocardia bannensis]NMH91473.1 GNAT family N-acetyltransferase [Pseudonocardia bannensis]
MTCPAASGDAAAAEPFITGPHPVFEPHPDMAQAFGSLWTAVVRSGGAVGFPADAPEEDIRAAAEQAVAEVAARRRQMLILGDGAALAGTVFLRRGAGPVLAHRAEVLKLMVRPDLQGKGWGTALLDAAVAQARALGLEQLLISTRGGTSLPEFYAARGWTEVGRFPGGLRLSADDVRDEHWFQLRLS